MTTIIDYYFSPASGYAYLGHETLMRLARESGATVRFRPADIDRICREALLDQPPRPEDSVEDRRRWARLRGLHMAPMPMHHPVDSRLAARVIIAAGDLGLDQSEVALACMRGTWAEGRNIADPGDLAEAMHQIDLPGCRLMALAERNEIRDKADDITLEIVQREAVVSPTYMIGSERFLGQDRLPAMAETLHRNAA
ncbi:2-hydroxychromene-2-carboxylate isomerase [Salipiger aestuarii]|uniref:2-hydroxychromene-2-carboxylate isomerase n=1 Tax=Salipiger aestuarii TaxID=568098 RepID=A0A327XZH7_9RHOB|nr:DsbA family protein [Salipiger aestuarii]KAB2540984.1 2-hydroxychromene-2-carboxylate isomerase [Salipiger aestuarii]RAK13266.1 2-hydroxychromene-2-carboxylate isomerase [Salipiger aestuarii]